jgi:hypothetical protein
MLNVKKLGSILIKMEIKTISSFPGCPFNDTFETFFDTHNLEEDVECYQLLFCPYGTGTCFNDLYKIKFKTRVVILNIIDLMIDSNDNFAIDELKQFCEQHPEQNFIIFSLHLNLKEQLSIPNLYLDTIVPTSYTERLQPCEKKEIKNNWLSLNSDTKVHRVLTVCYLLSKSYHRKGYITFNMNAPTLVKPDKYKNITRIPSGDFRYDLAKGYGKFISENYNHLKIRNFDYKDDRVANNYNVNLLPVYERIAVEIITGTMFFEPTPVLTEKEVQSIYAKNFPIYINGPGIAREIKKFLNVDIFEDIVDHSYDEIEDHFDRLAAAIDRNQHLLDGSTNIKELWNDNRERFENNCKIMDDLLYDRDKRKIIDHQKIKQALKHFDVAFS